jgi:hypothetical protein
MILTRTNELVFFFLINCMKVKIWQQWIFSTSFMDCHKWIFSTSFMDCHIISYDGKTWLPFI